MIPGGSDRIDAMKRVFASQDRAAIAIVCGLLADEGIETTIQNENMSAVSGEVPFGGVVAAAAVVRKGKVYLCNDKAERKVILLASG